VNPGAQIIEYDPRWLEELVSMWRESFEAGVDVKDPHPLAEQQQYFLDKVLPRNLDDCHLLDWAKAHRGRQVPLETEAAGRALTVHSVPRPPRPEPGRLELVQTSGECLDGKCSAVGPCRSGYTWV
jgi:hypothetical protein